MDTTEKDDRKTQGVAHVMEETVYNLCESMKREPDRWEIHTCYLQDKKSGIKYWTGDIKWGEGINTIWSGLAQEEVFTKSQAKMLEKAYKELSIFKATIAQEKIINSMKNLTTMMSSGDTKKEVTPWWKFWG